MDGRIDHYLYDCNYIVEIGKKQYSFSKISGLEIKNYRKSVYSKKNALRMKRKRNELETLTFEKAITNDESNSIEHLYNQGQHIKELTIMILDEKKEPKLTLYFEEGVIKQKTISSLDAASGSLLMLTMKIEHTGLIKVI